MGVSVQVFEMIGFTPVVHTVIMQVTAVDWPILLENLPYALIRSWPHRAGRPSARLLVSRWKRLTVLRFEILH